MPATPPHRGGGWEGGFFSLEELTYSLTAQQRGIENIPTEEHKRNLTRLVDCVLDRVRAEWGSPIIVTSGYRCEALNKAVGGVTSSYHMRGMAADIRPQRGALGSLFECIMGMFMDGDIGLTECYIDSEKGFIHVAYDAQAFNVWPFISN